MCKIVVMIVAKFSRDFYSLQDETIPSFSSYVMCVAAILAGIGVRFCPETYLKRLPDTLDEAKEL